MTGASEPRGMQLPPPDLGEAYAGLPRPWQVGAVLLADRILAAAYAQDVRRCAMTIAADLEAGAVRGMTLPEYVDEAVGGHPRTVDVRRALQALAYSAHAGPWPAGARLSLFDAALRCFRSDVQAALFAMGVAMDDPE